MDSESKSTSKVPKVSTSESDACSVCGKPKDSDFYAAKICSISCNQRKDTCPTKETTVSAEETTAGASTDILSSIKTSPPADFSAKPVMSSGSNHKVGPSLPPDGTPLSSVPNKVKGIKKKRKKKILLENLEVEGVGLAILIHFVVTLLKNFM